MKTRLLIIGSITIAVLGSAWLAAQSVRPFHGTAPGADHPVAASPGGLTTNTNGTSFTYSIGPVSAAPAIIPVNTATAVTVTANVGDPTVISSSVTLLRYKVLGAPPTVLGQLQDHGNGVYSIQVTLNEALTGNIFLRVTAKDQQREAALFSDVLTVPVWNVASNSQLNISVEYPPELIVADNSDTGGLLLRSSQKPLLLSGGTLPPNTTEQDFSLSGYEVTISSAPFDTSNFQIDSWLANVAPYSQVASITPITVDGLQSYEVVLSGELTAGAPAIIVPNGGTVYSISYDSTYDANSANDQAGIAVFNAIVSTLHFLR